MQSEIVVVDGKVLHLGLARGQLANNIFLVGDPARALKVANRFDRIDFEVRNREYVTLTGTFRGTPVSVIGTGIGVDNVEIALVEAYTVAAFDFDSSERRRNSPSLNLMRIGTSAGVQDDVEPGTLAIATYGLGLDNAGLYYDHPAADDVVTGIERQAFDIVVAATPESARFRKKIIPYASKATPSVAAALKASAAEKGFDHVSGITASTPGFYGPSSRVVEGLENTVDDIKHRLSILDVEGHRVVNMEMESSLMFHLAAYLGYAVGTVCPVISKPSAATAILDYSESVENAISVALDAMLALHHAASAS